MRLINIIRLTWLELWQSRTYRIMLLLALVVPLAAMVVASLFMSDIGKVYVDGIAGASQLLAIMFALFLAVSLLARDIYDRVCYLILNPPIRRSDYFIGRYLGLTLAFALLLLCLLLSSSIGGAIYIGQKAEAYQSGFSWVLLAQMMFFYFFQYIAILGIVFFIVSWASGDTEAMLFTVAVLLFSWLFPPVLKAMQDPNVMAEVPGFVMLFLNGVYEILPHMQGSQISLMLAHGIQIGLMDTLYYVLEHTVYGLVFFVLGLMLFKRRDL